MRTIRFISIITFLLSLPCLIGAENIPANVPGSVQVASQEHNDYDRKYNVCLLTTKREFPPDTRRIGDGPYDYFGDSELEDYIELLSASGISFNILYSDEFHLNSIVKGSKINCVSLVNTVSTSELSDDVVDMLKTLSGEYGISLITSYDHIDHRLAPLFGISEFKGKKYHMPVVVSVTEKGGSYPHWNGNIRCGVGWRLTRNPGGFRRNFKKFLSQVRVYRKIELLSGAKAMALTQDGYPALVQYQYGKAVNHYISLSSNWYLEQSNRIHQLIRRIVIENSGHGMPFFDHTGTMVLRLDDPGSSYNAYHTGIRNLESKDWRAIVAILKKHEAILNVSYVPGWIDDGNGDRGDIFLRGRKLPFRHGGEIYDSKDVVYISKSKSLRLDYIDEYRGITMGQKEGFLNIEAHGLTHLNTNVQAWLNSDDKYSNNDWWYEFRDFHRKRDVHPQQQNYHMRESRKRLTATFGVTPVTFIPPGHEMSTDTERIAQNEGFLVISSEYNSILKEELIIKNDRIPSMFLSWYKPAKSYFESGYPVIGLFHDYDLIEYGNEWLEELITGWKKAGVKRFISFKELAGYLFTEIEGRINGDRIVLTINTSNSSNYFTDHEMVLKLRLPQEKTIERVEIDTKVSKDYKTVGGKGVIRITIPPFGNRPSKQISVFLRKP